MASHELEGMVEAGWGRVADVFRENFEERRELGAAMTVYVDGAAVVDLWGGVADATTSRPWAQDTVSVVFSTAKGVSAICIHLLAEKGLLDLEAPVAAYWPEFAQEGKAELPLRWLLSHQAGLPYVDQDMTLEDVLEGERLVRALAGQRPLWEPGTAFAYHAVTFGPLLGEVVRRATGRSIGQVLADEVATSLGLSTWLGLHEDLGPRLARIEAAPPLAAEVAAMFPPDGVFARSITLGGALPLRLVTGEAGDFNDPRVLDVELAGSNLVSDARSLARLYAATVGEVDGLRLLSPTTVENMRQVQTEDIPYFAASVEGARLANFSLGFMTHSNPLTATSFGHGGAGGSLAFADPENNIGFAYIMNRMDSTIPEERASKLVDAVRGCL